MTRLEPCPHCHRHVKVTEASCPFCAHALADAFATVEPRAAPRVRLGRAATFAFGALALAQGGCGDDTTNRKPDAAGADGRGTAVDASTDASNVPIYAAAPTADPETAPRG